MSGRIQGFSLIELMVAMAVMLVVTAAMFSLVLPAHAIFRVQPEAVDVQQRLRVLTRALERDLLMAGAGPYIGKVTGPLHRYVAPVLPYRVGAGAGAGVGAGAAYSPDAITLFYVPSTAAQASVRTAVASGSNIEVVVDGNCGQVARSRVCGFTADTRVLLFDVTGAFVLGSVRASEGHTVVVATDRPPPILDTTRGAVLVEVVVHAYWLDAAAAAPRLMHGNGAASAQPIVDHVVALEFQYFGDASAPAILPPSPPLFESRPPAIDTSYGPSPPEIGTDDGRDSWAAGENCVFAAAGSRHVPRLTSMGRSQVLVRLEPAVLTDGPWCPDATARNRFDADLLRIRHVRVRARVEAPSPFRGAVGRFFSRPGTATAAIGLVPDQEVEVDVFPRNLGLRR